MVEEKLIPFWARALRNIFVFGCVALGLSIVGTVGIGLIILSRGGQISSPGLERSAALFLEVFVYGAVLGLGCTKPIPAKRWVSAVLIVGVCLVSFVGVGGSLLAFRLTEEVGNVVFLAAIMTLLPAILCSFNHFYDEGEKLSYSKCPSCTNSDKKGRVWKCRSCGAFYCFKCGKYDRWRGIYCPSCESNKRQIMGDIV